MLLSIGCGFDDMVKESILGGAGEECLDGIIQTVKDLTTQVDIKTRELMLEQANLARDLTTL